MLFSVNVEALQVECAVNAVIYFLLMPKNIFTYRAILCVLNGLCGCAYDKISTVVSLLDLFLKDQYVIYIQLTFWIVSM